MLFTLKKAHALELTLDDLSSSINIENSAQIGGFDEPEQFVNQHLENLLNNINRKNKLLSCIYDIRLAIENANFNSGISTRLTQRAFINKKIALLEKVIFNLPDIQEDYNIIKKKLEKISQSDYYSDANVIKIPVLTKKHVATFTKTLSDYKRQRVDLNDEISMINLTEKIVLKESTLEILKEEGLI